MYSYMHLKSYWSSPHCLCLCLCLCPQHDCEKTLKSGIQVINWQKEGRMNKNTNHERWGEVGGCFRVSVPVGAVSIRLAPDDFLRVWSLVLSVRPLECLPTHNLMNLLTATGLLKCHLR